MDSGQYDVSLKKNPEEGFLNQRKKCWIFIVFTAELVYEFNICSNIKLSYCFAMQSPW